ncbi:hypothetical protein hmeg3_22235 [Herbaspirillum sp. meg3]|uniref:beta strand repeat-containing protein n=1 Tax=Herbaspirillum sp. meg3 TaxID=2025949 RepID=UPI000B997DF9|nr:filamentous hemagglutinin N-terminal domain-containing protein [Herbaspirillum sp. meg3]ASU40751.1 hypothetical protein hmeg3_22235 [Herbaspirillum sp. meg3]
MTNPDQKTTAGQHDVSVELMPPSFTMRVGNRRLTVSWRPRKAVPMLLTGLLRRSWRAMFGNSLRISMTAAAICAAWNVPALAAAPPVNTLPTTTVNGNTVVGGTVTYGNATFTQNGNTLNINQTTGQAIANFTTFSIGSNAVVDISQPNSAAAFLARVTGTDPSLIYGLLKSNGTVALINQNGIMVGPGGVVDVARFIASTLNISDNDFLAGRLTFNAGATAGNVDNQGTIKTATGGSVYLIGANVSNSGVIQSPNGEILLAAGQTVQLVDTATPGVSVNVTGATGSVTNLGVITAEAGRIGIAAGLINNSGNINASSVVSEGGRIFLRASQSLTTTASSNITADGATKGGSVVLYSDKVAYIDGNVSAQGAPGQGGYVDTSGLKSLDVVNAPTVGSGGTWLIDPYDLEVVSDAVANAGISTAGTGPFAVTSTGTGARIRASSISTWLSQDMNVTLATTGDPSVGGDGNITINAAITKSAGAYSALTLNADGNIYVNANITSTSGRLDLNMLSNYRGISEAILSNEISGATVSLNGGVLNVSDGLAGFRNGNLTIKNGGVLNLGYNTSDPNAQQAGAVATGNLTVDASSSIVGSGYNSNLTVNSAYTNNGTLTLADTAAMSAGTFTNNGNATLTSASAFTSGGVSNSGNLTLSNASLNVSAALDNTGTVNLTKSTIWTQTGFTNEAAGIVKANYLTSLLAGQVYNYGTMTLDSTANKPTGYTGDTTITVGAGLTNNGTLAMFGTVDASGGDVNNNSNLTLTGASLAITTLNNNAGGTLSGTGSITANGQFTNNGVLSPGGIGTVGAMTVNGNFTQGVTGVLNIDVASASSYDVLTINAPTTVNLGGTLQSKLLGGYVPTLDTRLSPIVFTTSNAGSSYFRHVLGDVIGTGDNMQMLKVDYKGTLALVMSGSADLTYSGNSDSNWGNALSWTGGVLPTAIDNVFVAEGSTLSQAYGDGVDTIKSITFNNGSGLTIGSGNTVNVGSINTLGSSSITITGTAVEGGGEGGEGFNGFSYGGGGATAYNRGVLNLSGTARISSLTLSNGGTLNGGTGSILNVTDNFSQTTAGVINSNGTVALSRNDGDLVVGNITARNLLLEAQNGAISQGESSLHVMQQLLTSSSTGTTLNASANRIAAFAGNNRGINDIVLVNNLELADTSAVKINGVTNANGSISIDNTGAAVTTVLGSGANFLTSLPTAPEVTTPPTLSDRLTTLGITTNGTLSAGMLSHTVSFATHSPLTIGSGGVTAAGGISLGAGVAGSGLAADALVVNGLLTSTNGGTIALTAGGSINVNANISTSGLYTPSMTPTYAPGVSITTSSGTVIPVAALVATQTTQTVTPTTDTTSQIDRSVNNTQTTSTSSTTTTGTNPVLDNTQTTGGTAGTFGGDDTETTSGQGSTPASGAKKVVKLYCS